MKYYDMWIGKLVPKSNREKVLKELNPIPLVQGQHQCEYDIDVKRVPKKMNLTASYSLTGYAFRKSKENNAADERLPRRGVCLDPLF